MASSPPPSPYNHGGGDGGGDDHNMDLPFTSMTDDFAAIAPRFTGSISALASLLIIFIIARSRVKLSTIYHRIMFVMSCAGIMSSVAMALTTLPMPRSEKYKYNNGQGQYQYQDQDQDQDQNDQGRTGTMLGNMGTCSAQGFFLIFGIICMTLYNSSLCTYYACAIAFGMRERNIQKYVEPFLHIVPLVCAFVAAFVPLPLKKYGTLWNIAWCVPTNDTGYFLRGSDAKYTGLVSGLILFQIVVCLSLIIWRVITQQRMMNSISMAVWSNSNDQRGDGDNHGHNASRENSYGDGDDGGGGGGGGGSSSNSDEPRTINEDEMNILTMNIKIRESRKKTKAVIIQALAYILSSFTSLSPLFLRATLYDRGIDPMWLARTNIILLPLQGFFNAIIFVSHKIYNYLQHSPDLSLYHIFIMLCMGYPEPVLISRISMVQEEERMNIKLEDEMKVESMSFDVVSGGVSLINLRLGGGEDGEEGESDVNGGRFHFSGLSQEVYEEECVSVTQVISSSQFEN